MSVHDNSILPGWPPGDENHINLPIYPANEDIYAASRELENIDPEDIRKKKSPDQSVKEGETNEKDFDEDKSGDDLDVPGSELDDDDELIGEEDEENNYYSLGGDNHNDLEEDSGE